MNKQKLIVLSPNFSQDSMIINQASVETQYSTVRFGSWNIPESSRKDVIAVYGEDLFTKIVADQCGLELLKPEDDWLSNVPVKYTLRDIQYARFFEIQEAQNKFIKPVDFKFFPAGVYENVQQIQGFNAIDSNIEVFVSDVVHFTIEVRCFVMDRKVQTWSTYVYNDQIQLKDQMSPKEENMMLQFTNDFLSDASIKIPDAVVIDVGFIPEKGWALIEVNPVWSSGVYACNPKKVIETIVRSCKKPMI